MHIEITPNRFLVLLNSGRSVAIYLAPVHPSGCPSAIAPPLGFTLVNSIPTFPIEYKA